MTDLPFVTRSVYDSAFFFIVSNIIDFRAFFHTDDIQETIVWELIRFLIVVIFLFSFIYFHMLCYLISHGVER